VQRDVARRHRNRRLAVAVVVVIGLWVVIGVVASADRPGDAVPIQSPTPAPSPTVGPGGGHAQGWPSGGVNRAGVYSWDGSSCAGYWCGIGWMHNATGAGSGDMSIVVDGRYDHIQPHVGSPVTIFGYEGSYRRHIGTRNHTGGRWDSCEQWMVDIQGTTITIKLCSKRGAPAGEIAEAHEIIESIRVENRNSTHFRLLFTLTTNTWDSG
jgi:hypothetical protein